MTSGKVVCAGEITELVSRMELVRTLECPICREIPLPPIYICQNGHNICSGCRSRVLCCGLCQGKLTETRNYAIESIVSSSKFKCKYASDGCPMILKGENHVLHLKDCKYGPILCSECSVAKCIGTPVPFKEYFKHLKGHHKIAGENEPSNPFPITSSAPDLAQDRNFPAFYMIFDQREFLSHVRVKNGMVYWWVSLIGHEDEAVHYTVKLLLYKEGEDVMQINDPDIIFERMKIEWTFPVHSIRERVEDIFESGRHACLSTQALKPYTKINDVSKKITWSTKYFIAKN